MLTDEVLVSQYRAALGMLRSAIEACPDPLWTDPAYANRTWHVAYHAIFYAHLYLSRSEDAFQRWEKAIPEYHYLGRLPWPPHDPPKIAQAYTRPELLEYCDLVIAMTPELVRSAPLGGASGFSWLPMSRRELHLYSLRHIQHHAGQLIERLGRHGIGGLAWIDTGPQGISPAPGSGTVDPAKATPQARQLESAIRSLEASALSIAELARPLAPEDRNWKPKPDAWSIHQIVCHLLDEEREDFRQRLRLVLKDPSLEWPPIDPQGWPASRAYDSWSFAETLAAWESERADSLVWLRSLDPLALALDHAHSMPWGQLRAGDLLASWVAHDLLHLRQITARRFQRTEEFATPYSTRYAGEW
jgi:hypothetical protein